MECRFLSSVLNEVWTQRMHCRAFTFHPLQVACKVLMSSDSLTKNMTKTTRATVRDKGKLMIHAENSRIDLGGQKLTVNSGQTLCTTHVEVQRDRHVTSCSTANWLPWPGSDNGLTENELEEREHIGGFVRLSLAACELVSYLWQNAPWQLTFEVWTSLGLNPRRVNGLCTEHND